MKSRVVSYVGNTDLKTEKLIKGIHHYTIGDKKWIKTKGKEKAKELQYEWVRKVV